MGDEERPAENLEEKKSNISNLSKISQTKQRISEEIDRIEKSISDVDALKQKSIELLEEKKEALRALGGAKEYRDEHHKALIEMGILQREIDARTLSITEMDKTIDKLDQQIAQIQAEHDKVLAELKLKKRNLKERLRYINELCATIEELERLLREEAEQFDAKINDLRRQRSELLKRTDLSETTLARMLQEIDDQMDELTKEHEAIMNSLARKLSDLGLEEIEISQQYGQTLTPGQLRELRAFEEGRHKMTKEERRALLRRGLQITPSGRIITKDDRIISYWEALRLGLIGYLEDGQDEWEEEEEEEEKIPDIFMSEPRSSERGVFYDSIPSPVSSSKTESSEESCLTSQDVEYLKRVFGKSLSFALAEITAVQPADPIHYLAHWLFKYRYNQEIKEVERIELQALMIERERLAAEEWHRQLEEEARQAILDVLIRAENIILQQEFERLALLAAEEEGEYEGEDLNINPFA